MKGAQALKILFCIGSLEKGGAERVISNLANAFSEKNDISIVTTIDKVEYEIQENIKLYNLEGKKTNSKKHNRLARIKKLYKVINEVNADVIVSFLREPTFRVLLLRKFIKTPIIVSVRNDPKIEYKDIKNRLLMKFLYPMADGFVFQTEEAKGYFSKKIQDKSIIIPNPIKKEFLERKSYNGEKENIIVSVGRLEEQKNHELLIDAFYSLKEKLKNYQLIIYGEGSLRTKLENKIKNMGMQDKILLPGVVDDIPSKIEKAKLFAMTSNYEGMPNALMEAMALGLPCISTDCPCGGPRYLIENNINGRLFEVNNIDELKKNISFIINHPDISSKIGENATKIRETLDPTIINKTWEDYIIKITNE